MFEWPSEYFRRLGVMMGAVVVRVVQSGQNGQNGQNGGGSWLWRFTRS